MGFNLFGSSSERRSSSTDNRLTDAEQTNNTGFISNGDGDVNYAPTDHGAVSAAIGSNAAVTQAAMAANFQTTESALAFGTQALDSNSYVTGLAFENSARALDTVSGLSGSVIDKINELATTVLVNGEKATRGALELAKTSTTSEAANITEIMLKAGVVLGAIAIIGAVVARGK